MQVLGARIVSVVIIMFNDIYISYYHFLFYV